MRDNKLVTVCEEAACPNIGECWSQRHATMMIMGEICTRACAFCNVATGLPAALDPTEPARVAEAGFAPNVIRGDFTARLAWQEEAKTLPFGAVWDHYCEAQGVPVGEQWLAEVKRYERDVLSKRCRGPGQGLM